MATRIVGFSRQGHGRKDMRMEVPVITVSLEGRVHHTVDWSLGGLLIESYHGALAVGDGVVIRGIGSHLDELTPVHIPARVVRKAEGGRIALKFLALPETAFQALQSLMNHRRASARLANCLSH